MLARIWSAIAWFFRVIYAFLEVGRVLLLSLFIHILTGPRKSTILRQHGLLGKKRHILDYW